MESLRRWKRSLNSRGNGYCGDGNAALCAVTCGAFDTLQTSVSIADQQSIGLTLPAAVNNHIGVIAKRPIANAAWQYAGKPENGYYVPYWERFQKLKFPFLEGDVAEAAAIALRFTLSMQAVSTAIVGTTNPSRWAQNAAVVLQGALPEGEIEHIRAIWKREAEEDWKGQA